MQSEQKALISAHYFPRMAKDCALLIGKYQLPSLGGFRHEKW